MKLSDRKIFFATLAAMLLPNFALAADAEIFVIDENYKVTKSFAQDWLNSAGKIVFYGGGSESFSGDVHGRQIAISGGKFNNIFGGYTSHGNIFDNELWINGGEVTGGVYGGITSSGSITGNKIYIQGGKISGEILAGKIKKPTEMSEVTNNLIEISGAPDLEGASIGGGFLGDKTSGAGNILHINSAGLTIGEINSDSFEKIYFNLPENVTSGETILNVADGEIDMSKVAFAIDGKSLLTTGDTVNLVINNFAASEDVEMSADVDGAVFSAAPATSLRTTFTKGATLDYELNLNRSANGTITATVGDFIGQSSNPIPQSDDTEFIKAIIPELDPFTEMMTDAKFAGNNFAAENFSDASEYKFFYNTGSKSVSTGNIKISRGSYDMGFARSFKSNFGQIFVAPVYESASANYTSMLTNNVLGGGRIKYHAGGIIARLMSERGLYFEGSFRAGRTENDFASNDFIVSGIPTRVTYSMDAPVFTGHFRVGDAVKLSDDNILDVYGIYFATRQSGKFATLSTGDRVNFDSATAQTFRLGYRLTTRTSPISKIYSGVAWQYEKNSDSIATAENYLQRSEGASGTSAMFEFGWQIKPNRFTDWVVDLNAVGWRGHQQGFNIFAKFEKSF